MAAQTFAGTVTLTGDAEGVRAIETSGVRDLATAAPMTADTLFQIASMTKAIVSVAALRLVEQGKLSLEAPLGELLPEMGNRQVLDGFDAAGKPVLRAPVRPITLRHLLTHTAGFGYEFMNGTLVAALGEGRGAPGTLASLDHPLLFDPGDRWEYGINTDWAGRAVEAATGQRLDAAVQALVTGPLGMTDTVFLPDEGQRARAAALYGRAPDGGLTPFPIEFGGGPAAEFLPGGAGLWSTAPDYYRFLKLILNDGVHEGQRLLSPETMALLTTNQIGGLRAGAMDSVFPPFALPYDPFPGMDCGWSMAFLINKDAGPYGRSANSLAWAGIANCHYWIDLARKRTGIFLTQLLPFGDPDALEAFRAFEQAASA